MKLYALVITLAGVIMVMPLGGQQLPPEEPLVPEDYDADEFADWMMDLRRYEIVAIGSFPITFFASSLVYDFSSYAANGFDPANAMGSQRGKEDIAIIIGSAAAASILIATVDIFIHVGKRRRMERERDESRRVSH